MKKLAVSLLMLVQCHTALMAQYQPLSMYDGDAELLYWMELKDSAGLKTHSSVGRPLQEPCLRSIKPENLELWLPLVSDNFEYFKSKNDTIVLLAEKYLKVRPSMKYFNLWPSHFYSTYGDHHYVTIDPLLHFSAGRETTGGVRLLTNRRGLRLTAGIDNKVFLFSELTENQYGVLPHVSRYAALYRAFPGAGFVKAYNSDIFGIRGGYDFILAEGGISFKATRHIAVQFGHGRHFIGQGIRSLLLSDFSAPQFYLKIQSEWGGFRYANIFSELSGENRFIADVDHLLQKKYAASHYLSYNVCRTWNIGLFETVVFNRKNTFEFQYLNPIILYRSVEQALGSPDNVLVGLQSHVHVLKKLTLYGQLMLDEFVFGRLIKKNEGWWANKYGLQAGVRYPGAFGIKGLMMQAEYNMVRPYTYSYADSAGSYSHYHQSLAHPLGSNFRELLFTVQYHPSRRWFATMNWMHFTKGLDTDSTNYGGNILKPYVTRNADFNNVTGQGLKQKVDQAELRLSYECLTRTWIDLAAGWRRQYLDNRDERQFWIEAGLRLYMNYRNFAF